MSTTPSERPLLDPREVDRQVETDLWWGSYAGRTMAPVFLLCLLLTVAVSLAVFIIWDDRFAHPQIMWHATVVPLGLLWLIVLGRWLYRTLTWSYRLTNQQLYRDTGFLHMADGAVALKEIVQVNVHASLIERTLGVGRLEVVTDDGKAALSLAGIHDPEWVARLIRGTADSRRIRPN
ncbi:MAG: PH domain-containing protein [Gemmataceae bacterium]